MEKVKLDYEQLTTAHFQNTTKYCTIGFIVRIIELYFETGFDKAVWCSSLIFLNQLKSFTFDPMNYLEALKKIRALKIKHAWKCPLLILIDEAYLRSRNDFYQDNYYYSQHDFFFLCAILRSFGVIPVFMGTSFRSSDWLRNNRSCRIRLAKDISELYLVIKLPFISNEILAQEQGKIMGLIPAENQPLKDFVLDVFNLLANERSWFANQIINRLYEKLGEKILFALTIMILH